MIITAVINLFVFLLGIILSWLPTITTIPPIVGYDIDGALVSGVGDFHAFVSYFWPLYDLWLGFLILMAYYMTKMVLRFFLGHRAPGKH
jgi:hypothetical protein